MAAVFKVPWILIPRSGETWEARLLATPELYFIHWSKERRSRPCAGERCEFCNRPIPEAPDKAWYAPAMAHKFQIVTQTWGQAEQRVLWLNENRYGRLEGYDPVGLTIILFRYNTPEISMRIPAEQSSLALPTAFDVRPTLAQVWKVPMSFFEPREEDGEILPFRKQA